MSLSKTLHPIAYFLYFISTGKTKETVQKEMNIFDRDVKLKQKRVKKVTGTGANLYDSSEAVA